MNIKMPFPSFRLFIGCCIAQTLAIPMSKATVLVADFNGINTGALFGQGGGTGFTGNWNGSASVSVISGNLTSTLYNVPQSGTAQRIIGNNGGDVRQEFRTVTSSPTGEVWFSFLTSVDESGTGLSYESAGISIHPNTTTTATPFNNRGNFYVVQTGRNIEYSFGAGASGTYADPRGFVPNVTNTYNSLFVGRLVINGGGAADTVSVWLNPDLIANSDITAYTPFYSSSAVNALDSINILGATVYQQGSFGGGELDNIRFSDGGGDAIQAYQDVTGVPEPSSLFLLGLALPAMLRRRRA